MRFCLHPSVHIAPEILRISPPSTCRVTCAGVVTILASLSLCTSSLGLRSGGRQLAAFQPPSLLATASSVFGGSSTAAPLRSSTRSSSVVAALRKPLFGSRLPSHLRLKGGAAAAALSTTTMSAAAPVAPVEKFRKDYKPTGHVIANVDLTFKIGDENTQVPGAPFTKTIPRGTLRFLRIPKAPRPKFLS